MNKIDYANTPNEVLSHQLAGNHHRIKDFCWYGAPKKNSHNWCLVYTSNRDSGIFMQAQAAAIEKLMAPFIGNNCRAETHSHWACGHVNGYSIRVFNDKMKITKAFKKWCDIQRQIEEYPILDEDDYNRRLAEATHDNVKEAVSLVIGYGVMSDEEYDSLASDVDIWLSDNEPNEVEDQDDIGGYPSKEATIRALEALGKMPQIA